MKAIVYSRYGPPEVLHFKDVKLPLPGNDEVRIRIHATAVSSGDVRMRKADPFAVRLFAGLIKPNLNILGFSFSGHVDVIGKNVKLFKEGDQVFGTTGMSFGAYAEYKCLPEHGILAAKPSNLSFEEAAAIPFGGSTALYFLRKGKIEPGKKILIYGASGAIGTAAVQLARYFGADITGVCSTANMELVKSLGATKVIDYTKEDFAQNGEQYDIIFDTVGKGSFSSEIRSLKKKGILILASAGISEMIRGYWVSMTSNKKVISGIAKEKKEGILFLKKLVETGKFRPVIDRRYSFEQIREAHDYVEKGHKSGNVVLVVAK